MVSKVNITANGRMSLPAEIRRKLGLMEGGVVFLEETDSGVVIRTAAQAVTQAQALARQFSGKHADGGVDMFLTRRKEDSSE